MCRSTEYQRSRSNAGDRLKIKAFFVHFSCLKPHIPLPESLTLLYLPRIDETVLEINGKKIRPDSPAYVTLYRVVSSSRKNGVVFGCRERVRVSEGVQFQVYLREDKVMSGGFRKDDDGEWKLECKGMLENEIAGDKVSEATVCVDVEEHVAMFEKVALRVRRKNRNFSGLEEIPEGREAYAESDNCPCSCVETRPDLDWADSDEMEPENGKEDEAEMGVEGVRWAVDLGFWVVCLGVGYLVSRASVKTLRRKRII